MATVVSLRARPPARYDGLAWTRAQIEEAEGQAGPYTTIDTVTLDPVDTDPRRPRAWSFTTTAATLDAGWYRVTFIDANGAEATGDAVARPASVTPALADVASLLNARIVDDGNNYLPEWTADTTPTAAQVQIKIAAGVRDVRRDLGETLETTDDESLLASARDLAALRAAMYVEESFYPEQTEGAQDVYPLFKRLYDEGVARLRTRTYSTGSALVTPIVGSERLGVDLGSRTVAG